MPAIVKCPFPWLSWHALGSRAGGRAPHSTELKRVGPRQRGGEDREQLRGTAPGWPQPGKKTQPVASGRMSPDRLQGSCILGRLLRKEASLTHLLAPPPLLSHLGQSSALLGVDCSPLLLEYVALPCGVVTGEARASKDPLQIYLVPRVAVTPTLRARCGLC